MATVTHAVDVRRREAERRARAERPRRRRPAEQQPILDHRALRDAHRAGGAVVVVEARVVVLHPADQPDGEMVVAHELLVDALAGVVADEVAPQLGPLGEPGGEVLELGAVEVPAEGTLDHAATSRATGSPSSSRAGFATVIA
jgi:hypothetical protein